MKVNIIIGCVVFSVLAIIQFYLFRLEKINDYAYRNRYTDSVYIMQDGKFRSSAASESDKVKSLELEIEKLNSGIDNINRTMKEQISIRDEEIKLLEEVSRRYFNPKRKESVVVAKRLCYMITCYCQGGYSVNMDEKIYAREQVMNGILLCRNKLEDLLKEAPE